MKHDDEKFRLAVLRCGEELSSLRDTLLTVEEKILTLVDGPETAPPAEDIATLQELDFVIQSIEALSKFLCDAAAGQSAAGPDALDRAAEKIGLGHLRNRLLGIPNSPQRMAHGKPELF